MAFKVGDRAVLVRSATGLSVGAVVTVTTPLFPCPSDTPARLVLRGELVHGIHGVEGFIGTGQVVCPPSWLEPLPDDGHERGEWDELTRKLCKPEKAEA